MKKVIITSLILVMVLSLGTARALKTEEGEKLTGKHYTLNIIGVPHDKRADMEDSNRHTIFVPLDTNGDPDVKSVKIMLIEDTEEPYEFQVLDGSATKGDPAVFQLPNPDPDNDGVTEYSVYARELGKPGGTATMMTCAEDKVTDDVYCSYYVLELVRSKGKPRTRNVSKELLYIYADIDDDGVFERIPLFDKRLEHYYWDYNNKGLKLLQLRFYPRETTVPGVLTSITPDYGYVNTSLDVVIQSTDPLVDFTGVQKNDVDFGDDIDVNVAIVLNENDPAVLGVNISIDPAAVVGDRIVTVEIGGVLYPIYFEVRAL